VMSKNILFISFYCLKTPYQSTFLLIRNLTGYSSGRWSNIFIEHPFCYT
jgi:hypothetical protein